MITNIHHTAGSAFVSFPAQPAWLYDLEWNTDLVNGSWPPLPGLVNLPGALDGSITLEHSTFHTRVFYRLNRHAP